MQYNILIRLTLLVLMPQIAAADTGGEAFRRGDFDTAVRLFTTKADNGDAIAQNNLGVMYLKGRGVAIDYDKARGFFEASAERGLAGAMFNLGTMRLRGYGGDVDYEAASHWFRQSAALGDREAQFFLGLMYYKGQGVMSDPPQAREWFLRAAESGLAAAQFNLAMMMLDDDESVYEDEALRWLNAAAVQGHELAQLQIAKVHLAHVDDPDRAAIAFRTMGELANAGEPEAQMQLGLMYTFGHGTAVNHEEGRFWLRQSALQGLTAAQINLASLYVEGIGTKPDLVKAYAWLALGAENSAMASEALAGLRQRIKTEDRELAEAMLVELRRKALRTPPNEAIER